jgi:anti-sigma factor ChrR (cupin superfamily)
MGAFHRTLSDLVTLQVDEAGLNALPWRDFGNGLSMARLAREGKKELVLYRIAADAAPDAFLRHEHVGGEFYLVLKGAIEDESGSYAAGDLVFLDRQSVHTPRGRGETVVLVLWPEGVKVLD